MGPMGWTSHARSSATPPVVYLNATGERRRVVIRNVRCVPEFTLPMLSVGQLWEDNEVDTVFRG
eukprot:3533766-Prymnesium_polylepis.1